MTLAYRSDGDERRPTLVLSGSIGTTSALWEAQLPAFTPDFRVVRYDHPGHGGSRLPDGPVTVELLAAEVVALLDLLELERVSFCGLSLGGMVGMALARRTPERVDRLVLACTAPYLGPAEGWRERARRVRAGGTAAIADAVLARWFSERFRAEQPATVARFRERFEAVPREGYAACCEAIAVWDFRGEAGSILTPTLVIAGAEDVATPPADAAVLAESIPNATLVVLPDAGHLANVEQPELFSRSVCEFLAAPKRSEAAA